MARDRDAPRRAAHGDRRPRRVGPTAAAAALAALLATLAAAAGTASAAPPTGSFAFSPSVPLVGAPVSFTAANLNDPDGAGISSVGWDFGDGTSGSGPSFSHAYGSNGTKTVTMTIVDGGGESTSVKQTLRVNAPPTPIVTFAALDRPSGSTQPFNVPYVGQRVAWSGTGSSDPDGSIASWAWDLDGDGTFVPGAASFIQPLNPPCPSNAICTVNVGLRIVDNDGAGATTTQPVRVDRPPVASFAYAPTAPQAGQRVQLTSTSTDADGPGDITSLAWDLDNDGAYDDASGPGVAAVFATAGTFPIGLRATDSVGVQAVERLNVVVAAPPGGGRGGGASGGGLGPGVVVIGGRSGLGATTSARRAVPRTRVRIAGTITARGTRVTLVAVSAPRGARVTATCSRSRCPRGLRWRVRHGTLRLRRLERTYRPGTVIRVRVSLGGYVTRDIRFTIRRGRPPLRREGCVAAHGRRVSACPAS